MSESTTLIYKIRTLTFAVCALVALLGAAQQAHAQCPSYYNPVRTTGLKYQVNVSGGFGLVWGKHKSDNLNVGSYIGTLNVDARGNIGMFNLGVSGDFGFGAKKSYFQIIDAHLGINFVSTGLAGYKYVLSHRSYNLGYYRLSHTRWCPQTQGTARHHNLTAGPKFVFTERGKGVGAHLTYRFTQIYTRSNMGWYAELQYNYGNLNALANGPAFTTTSKGSAHAHGGKVTIGYMWGYIHTGVTMQYFAGAWQFLSVTGVTFWGI